MNNVIYLINAQIVTPQRILVNSGLRIEDKKITEIYQGETPVLEPGALIINLKGSYLAPGFIDMHVHGGGGADLMDGTLEAIMQMAESHARGGTTSLVPTTTCSSFEDIFTILENIREAKRMSHRGAKILGVHLEGPYFSLKEKGAQNPKYIKNPHPEEYLKILDYSSDILSMSIAPELPGALDLGRELRQRKILASIGHTSATFDEVVAAVEGGFQHVTHLYSSMPGVRRIDLYRVAGVVEAAYLIKDLTVELIADGKHLPPPLLKLAYQIKGPDKIALVTDSMRAAGMPAGEYILGSPKEGLPVVVEDGVAKLLDRTAFAGSVALTSQLVANMIKLAGVPIPEAIRMASLTPARILGIDARKGRIDKGMDADLVVLDQDFAVRMTIVEGVVVYSEPGFEKT